MTQPTDAEIIALLRPLYASDEAASMGAADDLRTARAVLAKWGAAPQQAAPAERVEIPDAIERMAAARYKVVPAHESMFHRWAVVAGDGTQQLYIGRQTECQNVAAKFTGAFLDGAFVAMRMAPQQAAPAERRPLSDDQVLILRSKYPYEDLCIWSYNMGIADAEAAHGIKGGQHGAE